jgi:hypothetical protein
MSPEKTNELHIGVTGFLGNVTYVFLNLVIEVPIQTVTWPPDYNYLVFFIKTLTQVFNVPSDIAQVSIGLEYAGHSIFSILCN